MPDGAREKEWSQALEEYSPRGGLEPALILSVDEKSAVAFTRANGRINLAWPAISWARAPLAGWQRRAAAAARRRMCSRRTTSSTSRRKSRATGAWCRCRKCRAHSSQSIRKDGAIAALVGGFDYFASNYNRAVQAKRQPGSAFKPFLYSAALEQGFTPASIVNDAPLVIEDPTLEGSWRPQNDYARVSRTDASARSAGALAQPGFDPRDECARPGVRDAVHRALRLSRRTVCRATCRLRSAPRRFRRWRWPARTRCSPTAASVEPYYIDRIVSPDGKAIYEAQPRFACPECLESQSPAASGGETVGERRQQRRADPRAEQRRDALGRADLSAGEVARAVGDLAAERLS